MTGLDAPAVFFCLLTGCALGVLFLLLKALRLSLSAGRLLTALLDAAFGTVCGGVVFLTALAVDKGRLRLMQALLQVLGAWGAIAALDPLACLLGRGIRSLALKLRRAFLRPVRWAGGWLRKRMPAPQPKPERTRKKKRLKDRRPAGTVAKGRGVWTRQSTR